MSDDFTIDGEDGRSLAAEYVLGVLDAPSRRVAELRIAEDSTFAAEVTFWENRLAGLASQVVPVTPPESVWNNISAAVSPASPRAGLWNSLVFWRWSALASAALAAACLAVIYVSSIPSSRAPLVAALETNGRPGFVAAIDSVHNEITIFPASLFPADPRALELWLIAPGEQPRSLGLIEAGRAVRISVPPNLSDRVKAEASLAVSIEPPGGSPTGLPTGPVIASGKLTNL
jgi:anti-sigma-K factor RskA